MLGQISIQSQHCREKDIKSCVDQCIEMYDAVRKKFDDEKRQLEDWLHPLELRGDLGEYFTTQCV